jgi:hypothetical protein
MKKSVIIGLGLLSVSAFGAFEQKPPGAKFVPEASEARLQEAQKQMATMPEIQGTTGKVESERIGVQKGSNKAQNALVQNEQQRQAASALQTASQDLKSAKKGSSPWGWILVGLATLGSILGAKGWLDKNAPKPLSKQLRKQMKG